MGDHGYGAPSGGLRSTVEDLAKFYGAFLQGINNQFEDGAPSSGTSTLKQLPQVTSAKIAIDQPSKHESSYAFGPSARWHAPRWQRNDFVSLAEKAVTKNLEWHSSVVEDLKKHQKSGTLPKPFEQYVGTYWDQQQIFKIEVVHDSGTLYWLIQGLDNEKFPLEHYHDDVFTWLRPRNELSRRGRWAGWDQEAIFWIVHFGVDDDERIDRLTWAHDSGVPAVTFTKI
ncbi:hypothetical protein LMH87_000434 [Akanthomyces muscarius]|uniref:Peptidase S12 Pab87-related C-terminal domain-containing protein n=1 Tax=Akanthomyces muscarius TaxID=2231603 RepID=A0A9W8QGT3_AKAMU|nr:hypothetical protein LMH87_000434 [Akanthomyces muscarius]KAJ4155177.1 hypothetical protein LMH87_000434 [Akanthomyces muscarius]